VPPQNHLGVLPLAINYQLTFPSPWSWKMAVAWVIGLDRNLPIWSPDGVKVDAVEGFTRFSGFQTKINTLQESQVRLNRV